MTINLLKYMLIGISIFLCYAVHAQNIAFNPGFDEVVKCCEYRIYHAKGWFYIGAPGHGQKIDNRGFLKVICYNDTNRFYGIVMGSLIKPVHQNQQLLVRIRLQSKKTFWLYHGFVQQHTYHTDSDTSAFTDVAFRKLLVKNKSRIEIPVYPAMDSCNYIAFKFEDVLNLYGQFERVLIESVEVIDTKEPKKGLMQKYFMRVQEIYRNVQWHDFTVPCQRNRTLNLD